MLTSHQLVQSTTTDVETVFAQPDTPGVPLSPNVSLFPHVAPPTTTAVTVSPSRPEPPGAQPLHLVTLCQLLVLTTTTVRLNNVSAQALRPGVQTATLVSPSHLVVLLLTTAVTVSPSRPELPGVASPTLVTTFPLLVH